jgi:hypothetical protein
MKYRGESKRGRKFLRVAATALVVFIAGKFIHIRTYDVTTPGAQALWNQNELYIFVEQNKLAWSQDVWSFCWTLAKGLVRIPTRPDFQRIDCTVYRVTSSKVEEHLAKGWHVAGAVAPYKGIPHAFIGGDRDAGVYRWTGNDFVKLSPSEALAATSGYTYTDELFKREGWAQMHVLPVRGSADFKLTIGGVAFTVRSSQSDDGTSRVELGKGTEPVSTEVVYEFRNKVGFLSATGYRSLVE